MARTTINFGTWMMPITLKSEGENFEVLINDEDYERVKKFTWIIQHHRSNIKYCTTDTKNDEGKRTGMKLHRFIMGSDNGDERIINHIDGNGLNNLQSNLEICDISYNNQSLNTKRNFGSITTYKDGREKIYQAQVNMHKKLYRKSFLTLEEAQALLDGLKEVAIAENIPPT